VQPLDQSCLSGVYQDPRKPPKRPDPGPHQIYPRPMYFAGFSPFRERSIITKAWRLNGYSRRTGSSGMAVVRSEIQTLLDPVFILARHQALTRVGHFYPSSLEHHGFGPKICYFYPFCPISHQAYRPKYLHFYPSGDQSILLVGFRGSSSIPSVYPSGFGLLGK